MSRVGGLVASLASATAVLVFMALYVRLVEAVAASRLPRTTLGALAGPGGLAVDGTFHTASPQVRVLLGVLAFHLLLAAATYAVVSLLDALGPRHQR